MGKLIVTEFVTLDGVIEEPRWSLEFDRGEEGQKFKADELRGADAQLLGRITYEGFAQAWPSMAADWFGEKMNAMPKYVVSTTLSDDDADWTNTTVIGDHVAGEVSRVKEALAGDLLLAGSAELARSLAEDDLIDEYRLMVFPLVLGAGKRLFADGHPRTVLRLIDARPVGPDGVVILTYEPAR